MSAGTGTSAHSIRSLAEWTLASEPPDAVDARAHALSLAAVRCATPKVVRWDHCRLPRTSRRA